MSLKTEIMQKYFGVTALFIVFWRCPEAHGLYLSSPIHKSVVIHMNPCLQCFELWARVKNLHVLAVRFALGDFRKCLPHAKGCFLLPFRNWQLYTLLWQLLYPIHIERRHNRMLEVEADYFLGLWSQELTFQIQMVDGQISCINCALKFLLVTLIFGETSELSKLSLS